MAQLVPIFELSSSGTGTVSIEAWVDMGVIPTGKQMWFGYATFIAEDKACQFELRANSAGKSAGTVADTMLFDWASVDTADSLDRDLYREGNITSMTVTSTGVEHWWLRVRAKGQVSGIFDYIIYYTVY